ncbi:uncharacterized protein C7orf57-like [Gouania willdenowi]|uniref:Uncharacterized protein n=1 Tax=Gouania willdenowi TaxID=441366 RepID=A0A8C5HZ25_GOUWI|nr:uncharacterized protein C7orf57-like [Gouania willdenowi]
MNSEIPSVVTDDKIQPTKAGVKTGNQNIDSHISQIPGLSPTICTSSEKSRGRRVGVRESDSEYIKLAKQGGHKGLLWHEKFTGSEPNSYKPSDWFCPVSEDINQPSVITSEETKNPGAFQPLEPPFGTDSMSAWERDHNSNDGKEKNNNDDIDSQMGNVQKSDQILLTKQFRRTVFDKKPAPVNMSKLLSFGYAGDNIQQQ